MLSLTAAGETKGFIGERFDADAGLQYLNARYYDPRLGMFIQPDWLDPTQQGAGLNRFAYSANDPVNLRDPGGNAFWFAAIAVYKVASVAIAAYDTYQTVKALANGEMTAGQLAKTVAIDAVVGATVGKGAAELVENAGPTVKKITKDFLADETGGVDVPGGSKTTTPDLSTGKGYDAGDPPVRVEGEWSNQDLYNGLYGRSPKGLGRPDIHHGGQMPGGALHEIQPELHRTNPALHRN